MPSINENETGLLDVARAFKAEYDGLRNSRAIALYLKARNCFSKKPYTPLELAAEWPQEKTWMRLKSKENAGNWFFLRPSSGVHRPSSGEQRLCVLYQRTTPARRYHHGRVHVRLL